jgi:EmrB/QacA subfamily drug resistance transporter
VVTLAVCCTALFMTTLDNTIVNVALPSLQRELRSSASGLQWTVDSYVLVRASLLFICGSLADRFGRRRSFAVGLVGFALASLACSLAPNLGALIGFRALQAVGGALMTPSSLAIITNTFTDPERRARAVGIWSATTGLSTAGGPVLGGLLVQTVGWRSVFWVNVPIGIAALVGTRVLRESRAAGTPRRLDVPGQLLVTGALATLTYALISGPEAGWGSGVVVWLLLASVVLGAGFVVRERRSDHPLLDLRYFANPALTGAVLIAIAAFLALGGFLFFNTLYLQNLRGFSPLHAGLLTVPTTLATLVLAPWAGRITGRRGPRLPATSACFLIGAAMATLAVVTAPATPLWLLLVGYLLLGSGMGLVNPPATNAAVAAMPPEQAGVASATTSTARQVGTNLGIALLGSVVFSTAAAAGRPAAGHGGGALAGATAVAFTHGMRYGYAVAALLAIACAFVSIRAFRPEGLRTAEPDARQPAIGD